VRPVNLIPPEDRRGEKAPTRVGALSYVIVAVLAVALVAVTMVVLTNNKVSDRKAEKASLESQVAQAQTEASRYKAFADFASLQQTREETVTTLAQSRFDWERVLRELSIVIPSDVWLTNVTGKVSAQVQVTSSNSSSSSGASTASADNIAGPSLELQGCAAGHEEVANFLASLRDIDGVTRVSVLSSDKPDAASTVGSSSNDSSGATGGCQTRSFISQFDIAVAFDAVSVPAGSTSPTTPAPPASGSSAQPASTGSTPSAADQSQVVDGQQEIQQSKDSAAKNTARGHKAVNTFIPGT
jgi:Tfp pilus assembly protein PilN